MKIVNHLLALLSAIVLMAACSGGSDLPDPTPDTGKVHHFVNLTVQVAASRGSRSAGTTTPRAADGATTSLAPGTAKSAPGIAKSAPGIATLADGATTPTPGTATPADGTAAGEDDHYQSVSAEERESAVSSITVFIYPFEADINNDADAANTIVRAFTWRVTRADVSADGLITYTTGSRVLPDEIAEGDYKILVVANADLSQLDGTSLKIVRDYIYNTPAYSVSSTDPRYQFDPFRSRDFVMASTEEVRLAILPIFGPVGSGSHRHGSEENPYTPDKTITIERLAARIDLALDPSLYREAKDADGNVTERWYEYPVTDEHGDQVATFRLTHACPFNLTREQYLFKHTTTATDEANLTIQVPGREVQQWSGGVLRAANYVIDPETFHQGNTQEIVGTYYTDYLYRENIGENAAQLQTLYQVPRADNAERLTPWTNSEGRSLKYYTLSYSAENTVLASAQQTDNRADYLPGIRFYGKYLLDGAPPSTARDIPFDYLIRHAAPSGTADPTQPMAYGLVRNNIYRIYIRSIHRLKDDFSIQLQVVVLPWQYYEHSDIYM